MLKQAFFISCCFCCQIISANVLTIVPTKSLPTNIDYLPDMQLTAQYHIVNNSETTLTPTINDAKSYPTTGFSTGSNTCNVALPHNGSCDISVNYTPKQATTSFDGGPNIYFGAPGMYQQPNTGQRLTSTVSNKSMYIGSENGLIKFYNGSWQTLNHANTSTFPNAYPNGRVMITRSVAETEHLYVATEHGLMLSTDNGSTWARVDKNTQQFLTSNDVYYLAVSANGETILVGNSTEISISTDGGQTWRLRQIVGSGKDYASGDIRSLMVSGDGNVMAVNVGQQDSLLISRDQGSSWTSYGQDNLVNINTIKMNTNGNEILAGGSQGLVQFNWTGTSYNRDVRIENFTVTDIAVLFNENSLSESKIYLASADFSTSSGVWFSTNNGANWIHKLAEERVRSIAVNNSGSTILAGTDGQGLYYSTDDGSNFTGPIQNPTLPNDYIMSLSISSTGEFIVGTQAGISVSTNNGTSWTNYNDQTSGFGAFDNILAAEVSDDASNIYALKSLGGLAIFNNTTDTWTNVNENTNNWLGSENVNLLVAGEEANTFYLAVNDGVSVTHDGGSTWQNFDSSNPGFITATPTDLKVLDKGQKIYVATSLGLVVSKDAGSTWTTYTAETPGFGSDSWCRQVVTQNDGEKIYVVKQDGIFYSTDGGDNWQQTDNSIGTPTSLKLSHDGNTLFATSGTGLFKSTDAGTNWTSIFSGVQYLSVDANTNGQYLYATTNNTISMSDDSGATWTTVDSDNVPALNGVSNCQVKHISTDGSHAYIICSTGGLLITTNYGRDWKKYNSDTRSNFSTGFVTSIYVSDDGNYLAVATNGGLSVSNNAGENWQTFTDSSSGITGTNMKSILVQ